MERVQIWTLDRPMGWDGRMNLVYDPVNDTYLAAPIAQAQMLSAEYKALRQELYAVLAKYSREDAIRALHKTLEDWQA